MSRLIDADVMHREIDKYDTEELMSLKNIKIYINAQPTAYDTDKVVERLEGEATLSDVDGIGKCYAIDLQTAVIIVTKGCGIDG